MSEPGTVLGQRRRQVFILLVLGGLGVLVASVTVVQLPAFSNLWAVSDDLVVHVIVQQRVVSREMPEVFVTRHSTDGTTFDEPATARSGRLASVVADNGALYLRFHGGGVQRVKGGELTTIRSGVDWPIRGIGVLDNTLVAFGQDTTRGVITLARPDNLAAADLGKLVEYRTVDDAGGRIVVMESVRAASGDTLVWFEAPADNTVTTRHLVAAQLTGSALESPARLAFEQPADISLVGTDAGAEAYWRDLPESEVLLVGAEGPLHRSTFSGGKWSAPVDVDLPQTRWMRTGRTGVVRFAGRTFVYTVDYWFGVLYAGTFGTELRGDRASEKFLVAGPTPEQLDDELSWAVQAMMASFVAAGALGGLARLHHFERRTSPLPEQPLYATVTDRAAAAGLDFLLMYGVLWYITHSSGGIGPVDFWVSFLFLFAVYGAVMETMASGQTLGKRLLGLRVLSVDGASVSFAAAVQRNVLKFVEMITVGSGVCLMTRRFQRPGDLLAGTVVIKEVRMPRPVEE
ncbi:MAG TPA: RDD family protein [Planctomycetota bacterium]|nr:RDD family protein [Planctomycetota bacterium]